MADLFALVSTVACIAKVDGLSYTPISSVFCVHGPRECHLMSLLTGVVPDVT